jgi:macrolide transport system ATP-binding/permease protein
MFQAELEEEKIEHHAAFSGRPQFSNRTSLEESRLMLTWMFWEQLGQDLRYALRTLANSKAFTALAALSLALGIGANTAIYSFMDSILLRSLPVQNPKSLVMLNWRAQQRPTFTPGKGKQGKVESVLHAAMTTSGSTYNDPKSGYIGGVFPFPAFEFFQTNNAVFSSVFAYYSASNVSLTVKGQADLANGEYVSGDYFRGLGIAPAAGRLIADYDDKAGAPAVVVVSDSFSQKRFGSAANATGQSILINNVPFTVVGVTPPEFFGVDPNALPDCYIPLHGNLLVQLGPVITASSYLDRNFYWVEIMARLRPGVSIEQAQANLAPQFQQWVSSTASNEGERADLPKLTVKEGAGGLDALRRQYSKPLYVLLTLVGLILAIACANIANLLLARATARRKEMAVRLSMGAGRWRVMRQLLTESLLLASLGCALGTLFATWGIRVLTVLLANGRENFTLRAELNWHVLGATIVLSVLTGVLFGLAPAIQSIRVDVFPALKESRAGQPRGQFRYSFPRLTLSQMLVISQIAFVLLMLVAAGLFVKTLSNLQTVDLGFNRENILLFQLNARQAGHQDADIAAFYSDLQKQFGAIPGVHNATLSRLPLVGGGSMGTIITAGGVQQAGNLVLPVGPAFFTTMQIPMLLGREIEERDQSGSLPVAVVNELFAKAAFGDDNPLGQHITLVGPKRDVEIVGVSKTARYGGLKQDNQPVVYIAYDQGVFGQVDQITYELRTTTNPLNYVNTVREIVHQADARVPVYNVRTQAAQVDQSINQEIIFARLCTGFAILGLVIACVGLYSTMSYVVARRTNEIGIRMALGAQRRSVIWMVLRQVFVLSMTGLCLGLLTTLATSKFLESFLFGMKSDDSWVIAQAVVTLVAAAIVAGYVPARRASRIDPMVALRQE